MAFRMGSSQIGAIVLKTKGNAAMRIVLASLTEPFRPPTDNDPWCQRNFAKVR